MKKNIFTDFGIGFIAGFLTAVIIIGLIIGIVFLHNRNKELSKYEEKQNEIEALRDDYGNLTVDELLEIPDVRRAADGAAAEFDRRRDEILQRFRGGVID